MRFILKRREVMDVGMDKDVCGARVMMRETKHFADADADHF